MNDMKEALFENDQRAVYQENYHQCLRQRREEMSLDELGYAISEYGSQMIIECIQKDDPINLMRHLTLAFNNSKASECADEASENV